MSDPVHSFELILNKQYNKKTPSLYNENVQQKQSYKPKDVISSVFHQLKAIHNADSSKSDKRTTKHLRKYTTSTFTSVSNLSVVDVEVNINSIINSNLLVNRLIKILKIQNCSYYICCKLLLCIIMYKYYI